MNYSFDVLPVAQEDLQTAFSYYETISLEFAEDILLSVTESFKFPLIHADIYKGIRKCNIRRFPYGVYYIVRKYQITIIGIFHLNRNAKVWKKRMLK